MQIDLGSYTDRLEEYAKDLDICVQQAYKVSAFQTQFGTQNYFNHGHSRCLPNGNYDPIQCIERPGMEGKKMHVEHFRAFSSIERVRARNFPSE